MSKFKDKGEHITNQLARAVICLSPCCPGHARQGQLFAAAASVSRALCRLCREHALLSSGVNGHRGKDRGMRQDQGCLAAAVLPGGLPQWQHNVAVPQGALS